MTEITKKKTKTKKKTEKKEKVVDKYARAGFVQATKSK
jgi:hypothetical protein|tara:strand:+ start:320 stop:433 length:114 start_codon:yes stop_codon:yes gene_type:complete